MGIRRPVRHDRRILFLPQSVSDRAARGQGHFRPDPPGSDFAGTSGAPGAAGRDAAAGSRCEAGGADRGSRNGRGEALLTQKRVALTASLTLLLAACVPAPKQDGLSYTAPVVSTSSAVVAVPGGSRAEVVATVAARLREAGMTVGTANPKTGMVVARNSGAGLIDCVTLNQAARGNLPRIPAHAERAVLFDPAQPGQLLQRDVAANSQVRVQVGGTSTFAASIDLLHVVRVSQGPVSNPAKGWRAERSFRKGGLVVFPDGVSCVDNDRIVDIVAAR